MRTVLTFSLLAALAAPLALAAGKRGGDYLMYVGTYTRDASKGIYVYKFNAGTGDLTPMGIAAEVANPSFVTIHPNGQYLYAVTETGEFNGVKAGAVSAFSIDKPSGKLKLLNTVTTWGTLPCHLVVDQTGKTLIVVNYGSGSTAIYPVRSDGSLGAAPMGIQHQGGSVDQRQRGPHAHSVNLSADNRFAVVADLGLDKVLVYKLDAANVKLYSNDPPSVSVKPGSGPRHFNFHPTYKYGYVINEIGSSVTAFRWDAKRGALSEIQTISTLPPDWKGRNACAEVLVHPSGKFLYGSNRGHDSIAVYTIDKASGKLAYVENTSTQGKTPRNFRIDPSGNYLFAENQDSGSIVQFRIDQKTGKLTPTGRKWDNPFPVCIRFLALK